MTHKLTSETSSIYKMMRKLLLIVAIVILWNIRPTKADWVNHGGGQYNQRNAGGPAQSINITSVTNLALAWKFSTQVDVSATPSIAGGAIYFPGWDGNLYSVNALTGALNWKKDLTQLAGIGSKTLSRATPVISGNSLLVGLLVPAVVLALNKNTGAFIWRTTLDTAIDAKITMSGTVYQGFYYVGVSSSQEITDCCSFRGSFVRIDMKTGAISWQTFMLPANTGYYGAAVLGSSPSIDETRRLVYIATGNNYQVPSSVEKCEMQQANKTVRDFPDPCIIPANHENSILALKIDTGAIAWSRQLGGYDVSLYGCVSPGNPPKCPQVLGPDYDFGEAPMLIRLSGNKCIVATGQKSGVVWALDCGTGAVIWSKAAGPGGLLGGAIWGAATDSKRVYTNIGNKEGKPFVLAPSKTVSHAGGWAALDAVTGKVLWSTANPSGLQAYGPVSVVNGVVFGGSFATKGELYAMDASTGTIVWSFSTGATIYGGFSIAGRCVFGGNGYPSGTPGIAIFALCLNGKA